MKSRIVIGDVHGCYLTLMALLAKLPKGIPITLSGDLIDRGPRSKQVVEWARDNLIDTTKGNHEYMMQMEDPIWLMNGGYECLESYGCLRCDTGNVKSIVFPDDKEISDFGIHQEWMKNLPLFIEYPDVVDTNGRRLVVSHSSVASVWHMSEKRRKEMYDQFSNTILWGRPATIHDVPDIYNIFGHTPVDDGPKIKVPFANVDTGCCFPAYSKLGKLTALQYPEMIVYQQENIDMPKHGDFECQI